MTALRQVLMLVSCVSITPVALSESVILAAGKPVRRTFIVPANTALDVRLATVVASEIDRTEDPVLASLAAPLIVDGVHVAPVASVLLGKVMVENASATAGARDFALRFTRLRVGATTYDIRTAPIRYGAPRDTDQGKSVGISSGTRLRVELEAPLRMEVLQSK